METEAFSRGCGSARSYWCDRKKTLPASLPRSLLQLGDDGQPWPFSFFAGYWRWLADSLVFVNIFHVQAKSWSNWVGCWWRKVKSMVWGLEQVEEVKCLMLWGAEVRALVWNGVMPWWGEGVWGKLPHFRNGLYMGPNVGMSIFKMQRAEVNALSELCCQGQRYSPWLARGYSQILYFIKSKMPSNVKCTIILCITTLTKEKDCQLNHAILLSLHL